MAQELRRVRDFIMLLLVLIVRFGMVIVVHVSVNPCVTNRLAPSGFLESAWVAVPAVLLLGLLSQRYSNCGRWGTILRLYSGLE